MFKFLRRLTLIIIIAPFAYLFLLKYIFPPITITQINDLLEGQTFKKSSIKKSEMGTAIQWAVIAAEDQKFGSHNGFDIDAIKKVWKSGEAQEKKRGGSTISQQTAKNVFLWQKRSWTRKGLEAGFTWLIEKAWGKERILEIYLNVAEMGPGIYGIEAAAQHYYGKSAAQLSKTEAARIAAVLPSPKTYVVQPPSPYIQKRSQWILRQMNNLQGTPDLKTIIEK